MECKKCNSPKIIKSGKQMNITLRQVLIYGDDAGLANPENENLKGQLYKHYDEAGLVEIPEYDFKGNVLTKHRQCISDAELMSVFNGPPTDWEVDCYRVDWTGFPNIIDTKIFETNSEYDALNRVIKVTYPEDTNGNRKIGIPTYNRAGALEKVQFDETDYVEHIAYNAKGQRLLIAFGNGVMTRYSYDNRTFRLKRLKSEKFTQTNWEFSPNTGTVKQDCAYINDLIGNIVEINDKSPNCGVGGTSSLDREFDYDPLYRVISANGRESDTQDQNDYLYSDAPIPESPNANNVRVYTRQYSYDRLGNIQQLKQLGTNGFTRNFVYNTGVNTLQKIETPTPSLIENFTYDSCGNQLTAGTTRNYVWNAANQLITYYNQAGMADPTVFAQYDYSGMNRVSKLIRTGTAGSPVYERTIYIDGIFEYHILENGTTYEKNYVHVMDDQSRIAMVRIGDLFPDDIANSVTYNLENQIGSSVTHLDINGTVIDKEEYYPFGDSSLRTFTKKRYRYVGKEKDLESGLYYYGARYYVPWLCRFVSCDPLMARYAHLSPYNYASNNPITHLDIDGMQNPAEVTTPTGGGGSAESSNESNTNNVFVNGHEKELHNAENKKK